MQVVLSRQEWEALELAQRQERGVRNWRRYQAIRLLAQGENPTEVAEAVGCRVSSVYNWVAAWKRRGNAGLHEDHHGGRMWLVEGAGQRELERLLATDPQEQGEEATEWTVPLLLTHLQQAGVGVSEHTLRRALHRLGWRWKRPRYELGRPDPGYDAKKKRSWSR
jgi:transposase